MNRVIQNYFLRFSGLSFLYRELIQRNKVTIIFFHNWKIKTAEKAFKYYSNHYNVIGLSDFIEASQNKNFKRISPKALIITIDDGYLENYNLLPLIKKHQLPITIFLTAGIVNTRRKFWFDLTHPKYSKIELKSMSNKKRLEVLKEIEFDQEKEFEKPIALSKEQINEMKPYVNFQAHTMFHPILPNCSDSEAEKEIAESKQILEENFGLNINSLAFPNGNYSERDIKIAKMNGYKCCLTVEKGLNSYNSDLFKLKRFSFSDDQPNLTEIIVSSSGIRESFGKIKNLFV